MFFDRAEAGRRLARALARRTFRHPVVIAIPRGGVVTGAALAREIRAELDVLFSQKLQPVGAAAGPTGVVVEGGQTYLDHRKIEAAGISRRDLKSEHLSQVVQIEKRSQPIRAIRPRAAIAGRSVIVTDDGIASGATMTAVVQAIRLQNPSELIIAVPVAPAVRFEQVARLADDVVCLHRPGGFSLVERFYRHFPAVEDEDVLTILKQYSPTSIAGSASAIRS